MARAAKVLFIGASPANFDNIQIRNELAAIQDVAPVAGDAFEVQHELLAQTNTLRQVIHKVKPTILHISAHGTESQGIVLQDDQGEPKEIKGEVLARILEHVHPKPRLVILTSCGSECFAKPLLAHVNCVLGFAGNLENRVAQDFVRTFYSQLLKGDSVEDAYEQSLPYIALNHQPETASQFYLEWEDREDPDDIVLFPKQEAPISSRLVTTAFIVQPVGERGSPERERARRMYRKLIKPVCRNLGMQPIRAHKLHTSTVKEPIVSSLHTARLVIADIGARPWNPNVMTEVGFRMANGRPLVFLTDEQDDSQLPLLLKGMRVIRTGDGAEALEQQCREALRTSRGWESHYPTVEIAVYGGEDLASAEYTTANKPALKLYGCTMEEIVGRKCHEVDARFKEWMPASHRAAFDDEQVKLLQKCLVPASEAQEVRATRPLWLNEKHPSLKNTFHWPVLTQKRAAEPNKITVLRVVFVNITDWMRPLQYAEGSCCEASLPHDFVPHEYLPLDVLFVHNERGLNSSSIATLTFALNELDLRTDNIGGKESEDLAKLKARMTKAKLVTLVIGSKRHSNKMQENIVKALQELRDKPVVIAHSIEWKDVEEQYQDLAGLCRDKHYPYFKFRLPDETTDDPSGNDPWGKAQRIVKCVSSLLRQELMMRSLP